MRTGARTLSAEPPLDAVTDADGINDATWFSSNPRRLFRGRLSGGFLWVVRAMPRGRENTFIRVRTSANALLPRQDDDARLALLFFSAAWPDLTSREIRLLARRALKRAAI